jgi:regulator of sigma E protease
MEILVMVGQLLLALTILVGLHEWGHYIFARTFGIRVNKFYLFFDFLFPLPNVLNFALFKKQIGETEYGLGWFPLGGYVQIAGMIDETQDASTLSAEPEDWEFRAKPAWQRLLVMLGGIIVNVVLGVLIFAGILYTWGEKYLPAKEVKYGIVASDEAKSIGIQTGDRILKANGQDIEDFSDVRKVLLAENASLLVERNGQQVNIPIPGDFADKLASKKNAGPFVMPRYKFSIGAVAEKSEAERIGLKVGDKILAVNQTAITFYDEVQAALKQNASKGVDLKILRKADTLTLKANISAEGKLGFGAENDLQYATADYSIGQAFAEAPARAFGVITTQLMAFKKIFRRELSAENTLGSFFSIGKMFGGLWDWQNFWTMTGMLSMVLAFMNLLPIPGLDGGHAVFLLWEMITGRQPSEKVMERAQQIGTILILGLMVFAIRNDIVKTFFR